MVKNVYWSSCKVPLFLYYIETLQIDLDRLVDWNVQNAMKINPSKSKAVSFTRAPVTYFIFGTQEFRKRAAAFRNNLTQRFKLG